ncbi:GH92 family glycosyl hydrolase [Rheinheimera sp.]|uniref:GH92 family glycosyl hydrolase n=1 Tax=Rheinheimera sp. TaxID=1869214 RepID=UPI003D2ABFBC
MPVPNYQTARLVVGRIFCSLLWLQAAAVPAAQTDTAQAHTTQTEPTLAPAVAEPAALVYPFLDTANSRWFYFSSAARPFGMVSLFPDTALNGEWGSGYRYDESTVKGFNHIHEWQLAGLSLMPVSDRRPLSAQQVDYASAFSHDNEIVRPGYHQLHLKRYGIGVELTATSRVGFSRYQYQPGQPQQLLLQLGGVQGPSRLGHAEVWQIDQHHLAGFITNQGTERRVKPVKVYFHLAFSTPVQQLDAWRADQQFANVNGISGDDAGLRVSFNSSDRQVSVKAGFSYVSADNAKLNLQSELAGWDFAKTSADAYAQWNQALARVRITGGSLTQQRRFYTDLWHALQGRRLVSDVNGQYMDLSGQSAKVRQLPLNAQGQPRFAMHNSDSFWGAQWTIATLWPLVYPQAATALGESLIQYGRDFGLIPRGPSGGQDTLVMPGVPMTPFLVSLAQKGLLQTPASELLPMLQKNHSAAGLMAKAGYEHYSANGGGLGYYLERGYVPYPLPETESNYGSHRRGGGQTLEYAYQDFALAQLAKKAGDQNVATKFLQRSQNWRNLYDTKTGFIRPKEINGNWRTPFDPLEYEAGFIESNAAQATWFVPHDIDGLADVMGGKTALVNRLEQAFQQAAKQDFTAGTAHAQEGHPEYRRTPINYGNQPSIQTAFIFAAAGAPEKTQFWSRRISDTVYSHLTPQRGYNGDEDQGLMGSLAVLLKLGLFQLSGGLEADPVYQLGSPLFDEACLQLSAERRFCIKTLNNGADRPYISQIKLNGQLLNRTHLLHSEIMAGGVLELQMSAEPAAQQPSQ